MSESSCLRTQAYPLPQTEKFILRIKDAFHCNYSDNYRGGTGGGEHLLPPVPPLLPPIPFCELSPACLFSTNLAMLLLLSRPV